MTNTQNKLWGGDWTEKKLLAFTKYVEAYLTIINKYKNQNKWETIYFDGFAGCGDRGLSDNIKYNNNNLFHTFKEYNIEEKDIIVYEGAAERVLNIENKFNYYYFIDSNKDSIDKLKNKLKNFENNDYKLEFRCCDANIQILKLAEAMKTNNYAALVFLDPFGMQINWKSIEQLKDTRTDMWILIPTGVIINRLLDRNMKLMYIDKLETFFGLQEAEIKEYFYNEHKETNLFNETEIKARKVEKPIQKIAKLYIKQLNTIWKYVTESPLILRNSNNVPIYHLAFASNNGVAKKIASQIIK